jgi:hypothetical protein
LGGAPCGDGLSRALGCPTRVRHQGRPCVPTRPSSTPGFRRAGLPLRTACARSASVPGPRPAAGPEPSLRLLIGPAELRARRASESPGSAAAGPPGGGPQDPSPSVCGPVTRILRTSRSPHGTWQRPARAPTRRNALRPPPPDNWSKPAAGHRVPGSRLVRRMHQQAPRTRPPGKWAKPAAGQRPSECQGKCVPRRRAPCAPPPNYWGRAAGLSIRRTAWDRRPA